MNVGGWFDAGDFDTSPGSQFSVIQRLALAYREFNLKYDDLTVDENARARSKCTVRTEFPTRWSR